MELFEKIEGFDWDHGNILKNWIKHGVTAGECEEIFFNESLLTVDDNKHSQTEKRYLALGKTNEERALTVIFTIRENKIRVTSARDQNGKEIIMKKIKHLPKFKSEDRERDFWAKADTSEYFDFDKAKKVKFPNLKPSSTTISIRLPKALLEDIKILANRKEVPYQSLMKIYLHEMVKNEKNERRRLLAKKKA